LVAIDVGGGIRYAAAAYCKSYAHTPMPKGWVLLTFGADRSYGGNAGYIDEPTKLYRFDNFVPNARRLAVGDIVVIRDRTAMLGVARIQEITSHPGTKILRSCPDCETTQLRDRRKRTPRFRCKRGHEFGVAKEDVKQCDEFLVAYGDTFRPAPGALTLETLRAACVRYADQLSIQALELSRIRTGTKRQDLGGDLSGTWGQLGLASEVRHAALGQPRRIRGRLDHPAGDR
jgi:hypothetical protein